MPLYELTKTRLEPLATTTFAAAHVRERDDLQRLLRDQVEVVAPDVLVVSEEFGEFDGARRRIDLLGLGRDGRLVVIQLKRTEDGGHMELQALRYAAMVSPMTFDDVVEHRGQYAAVRGFDEDSRALVTDRLGGEETLADDVRIVLVSADFGVELTTAVLWLTERHDLDILCVRVVPYLLEARLLLDVQQVIPLPEARNYQVGLRRKDQQARQVASTGRDYTRYQLVFDGQPTEPLAKQQAVKQAVALVASTDVPFKELRGAVGNRWRAIQAPSAGDVRSVFASAFGHTKGYWFDMPFQDDDDGEPDTWWVMLKVGGLETEGLLRRLEALRPGLFRWQRVEASDVTA